MLIRHIAGELVIVRQTDHMAQAARVAAQWGNEQFPAPAHREETLRAAGLHDNGWRIWEDEPTLLPETRRPRNLTEMERRVHAAFYAAGVERAVAIDPYTGLLVNLHATALYTGVEGWDADIVPPLADDLSDVQRDFIKDQVALQRRLRAQLATSSRFAKAVEPEHLWPAYLRLRAWDNLSLFLVYHQDAEKPLDHIPTIDGETTLTLRRIDGLTSTATPWPFSTDVADVPVVVARVPDRPYEDGTEFFDVLSAATPVVEQFRFVR
jgi:hypothetical protein